LNNLPYMDETLREGLIAMRAEDLRVREELLQSGELGRGYACASPVGAEGFRAARR